MHVFLSYLLATALVSFAFVIIGKYAHSYWLTALVFVWFMAIVYIGLGVGLLYVVWRYVRRW